MPRRAEGVVCPIPNLSFTSSYAERDPKIIFPFVAFDVEESVRLFPAAVPPTALCPPDTPVERFAVIVPEELVSPVEKVSADCAPISESTSAAVRFRRTFPPVIVTKSPVAFDTPERVIFPEEVIPVAPVIAPAEEISMFVVSSAKVPDPPPILTSAFDVPVFIFVAKFELLFMETVAPLVVSPVEVRSPAMVRAPLEVILFELEKN